MLRLFVILVVSAKMLMPAVAQTDEARAKALFNDLRCVVCQNQSIASSEAGVARDLRQLVREQIAAGKSDDEIIDFLVERYGEFVLLKPRFTAQTLFLWLSPLLVVAMGIVLIGRMRTRKPSVIKPLQPDEEERLARLLQEKDEPRP